VTTFDRGVEAVRVFLRLCVAGDPNKLGLSDTDAAADGELCSAQHVLSRKPACMTLCKEDAEDIGGVGYECAGSGGCGACAGGGALSANLWGSSCGLISKLGEASGGDDGAVDGVSTLLTDTGCV